MKRKNGPLNEKLTTALREELSAEDDETRALRRALIHSILLLEDVKDPAVRAFVDYLLLDFEPLASEFTDEKHPYLSSFEAMRGRLQNGRLAVFLPLERVRSWLAAS